MAGPPVTVPFNEDYEPPAIARQFAGYRGQQQNPPPSEDEEAQQQQSRFESAVQEAGLPALEDLDLETVLQQAGVDVNNPEVQTIIQLMPSDLDGVTMQALVQSLSTRFPAVPVTGYQTALAESGFTGPGGAPSTAEGGDVRGYYHQRQVAGFVTNPDTGWVQYSTGVLVNPADGRVVYDPTSSAPGSPNWIRQVQAEWSPEKVSEWKTRLKEFGYLTKEQAKTEGIDQSFLAALAGYHTARYQNFGKAVPTDLAAIGEASAAPEFSLTARDFQVQIRNDVREQYRRVFGEDPTDSELGDWSRFVMQSAVQAQKVFERKGATPSSALSLAATEAEEKLVERIENSPEAEFLSESVTENTRLRDALSTAVSTTRSLAG